MVGSIEELRAYRAFGTALPGMGGVLSIAQQGAQAGADQAEMEYVIRMISPIYHLDDFEGVTAIFQSADDQVVSIRQSEAFARERARAGRPVIVETYSNLGHAFANSIENPSKEKFLQIVRENLLK